MAAITWFHVTDTGPDADADDVQVEWDNGDQCLYPTLENALKAIQNRK